MKPYLVILLIIIMVSIVTATTITDTLVLCEDITVTDNITLSKFTNGSILFISSNGLVTERNDALHYEHDNGGKLAVGDISIMRNIFQAVSEDSITNIENLKSQISVRNKGTTNNNYAAFAMQTLDLDGTVYSGIRLISQFTSHTIDSVSADLIFETRHNGVRSEKMKLTSSGNLDVTGDITSNNVFIPQYVFAHTNSTMPVSISCTWINVTFNECVSIPKTGITHTYNDATNTTFTITETGIYEINYNSGFEDSAASPNGHVCVRMINNGNEIKGSLVESDTSKQNSAITISNTLLVSLNTDDKIKMQFTSDDTTVSLLTGSTSGCYPDSAILCIKRIG